MRFPVRIGSVVLALVAMLLLSAIAAGVASAAKFEASPNFPVKFSGEGKVGLLETKKGHSVTCTSAKVVGEVEGEHAVGNVFVKFKGCFAEHTPALTCGVSGEIETNKIAGEPVDLGLLGNQVGLLLKPASGEVFAEFVCEYAPLSVKETLKVTGAVIGQVKTTELNEFRSSLDLEFVQAAGVQAWTQVGGGGTSYFLLTEGEGTAPFAAEQSAVGEAAPGSTTVTALEGKQIKVVP